MLGDLQPPCRTRPKPKQITQRTNLCMPPSRTNSFPEPRHGPQDLTTGLTTGGRKPTSGAGVSTKSEAIPRSFKAGASDGTRDFAAGVVPRETRVADRCALGRRSRTRSYAWSDRRTV